MDNRKATIMRMMMIMILKKVMKKQIENSLYSDNKDKVF